MAETVEVRFKPGTRVRPMHGLTSSTGSVKEVRLTNGTNTYLVRWDGIGVTTRLGYYLGEELRRISAAELNFSDWLDNRVQKQSRAWAEKFSVRAQSRAWDESFAKSKKNKKSGGAPTTPEPASMAGARMRMGWSDEASRRQWRERRMAG